MKNGGQVPVYFIVLCPELTERIHIMIEEEEENNKKLWLLCAGREAERTMVYCYVHFVTLKIVLRKASPKEKHRIKEKEKYCHLQYPSHAKNFQPYIDKRSWPW